MDFRFREEQDLVRRLAREILEQEVTAQRLRQAEASDDGVDPSLWSRLAAANLLGLAVPERLGGMGFGFLELCVLLEELGRAVAPVPVYPALVLAGLPLVELGTPSQQERWLAPLAAGERFLTGVPVGSGMRNPTVSATQAAADGSGWLLSGPAHFVPALERAARMLVPAAMDGGVGLFLLAPDAPGVQRTRLRTTTGVPLHDVQLTEVRAEAEDWIGQKPLGARSASRMFDLARVSACAMQLGVAERALEITCAHVRERRQFGLPIGSFQAVQQRAADAYVDLAAMRWTTWRAAWRLSEGQPAAREATVAKFWAAEGGSRIANTAQHLHGGLGVDLDYPLHRYFLWSKALELELGSAGPQLALLGRDMARTGPPRSDALEPA